MYRFCLVNASGSAAKQHNTFDVAFTVIPETGVLCCNYLCAVCFEGDFSQLQFLIVNRAFAQ